MLRTWNQTITSFLRAAPIVALALAIVAPVSPAAAQQSCASLVRTLLDTTDNCVSEPWRPRASDVETFRWKGHDYVIFNSGNELSIFNIDDPKMPVHTASSGFDFGTVGDSDYDLIDFDVCDDCRFGVFSHKVERTVVFDLGTGSTPSFPRREHATYPGNDRKIGGYVFTKGTQQYLVSATGPGDCVGASSLYTIDGIEDLGFLSCIEAGGSGLIVKGLHDYDSGGGLYLFTEGLYGTPHVFRADGNGAGLSLVWETSPEGMRAAQFRASIDRNNALLASVDVGSSEIQIWDISKPYNPVRKWTVEGRSTNVSLRSPSPGAVPTLMVNRLAAANSTRTFTVGNTGPEEFEPEFWTDESLPHNDLPVCTFAAGGALSADGSTLFLSRYAIHQVFDLSDCLDPTPAVANLEVTPSAVFPGDTVDVRDTTTGRVDGWALWITKDGGYETGETDPIFGNPREIDDFQIPQDVLFDTVYEAHILVKSDDLTPEYASCEENPLCDGAITINRTPGATISVSPSAVVVDESVTLTATAEGNPGANPYTWTIDPPLSSSFTLSGATEVVALNETGPWAFYLTVDYQHGAADGGSYQATAEITGFNVTSVAADFTIKPSSPLHTQDIVLDGSISKPAGGDLSYQWAVESNDHDYIGCPAAPECTIPAESLNPGTTYTVTLMVTNTVDNETDQRTKSMFVGDGSVDPSITFSPPNPEIGQNVVFTIQGVPGDIDKATWTMGGSGCDGADSTPECTPSFFNDCKALAFKYAFSGTKPVHLEIEIGGNIFETDTSITVASTGSCDGTTPPIDPPTCSYDLDPSGITFGPDGGPWAFTVLVAAGCSWTAQTNYPWITIISPTPTTSESGSGTVNFRVDANTGAKRVGSIVAGGESYVITQQAPWVPPDFTMSNVYPEIGEVVTFTAHPALEVASWDFGEANCDGGSPVINCGILPSGVCNTWEWAYPTSGPKTIKMVLTDGQEQIKGPTVQSTGECCFADGRPDARFTMSADEVYTGEKVVFTDTSSKSAPNTKALGFSWTPPDPEIGDDIVFTLSGVVGDIEKATWDFGDASCDGPSTGICEPTLWNDCSAISFAYASGGEKLVSVTLELSGGGTDSVGPVTVDVANSGTCDTASGGCSYTLNEYSASFPPDGGTGSFNVSTTAECAWNATTTSSWVTIEAGAGAGPGSVDYTVAANVGLSSRSATIKVEGKIYRVTQGADQGNTAPTVWQWTVTRVEDEEGQPVNEEVATGNEQHFSHIFNDVGLHRVSLNASNCSGSDSTVDYITVEEALVEDFVVGAAVSLDGAYDTRWESDFRFFNPCGEDLDVRIEYQPGDTNNTGADLVFREFGLGANETRIFADITEAIPGLESEDITGSVRIESQSDSGCKVMSFSRTFNSTPDGSLGLYVPALPVKRVGLDYLDLTGLIHNSHYRSNLRLVNYRDEDVWVSVNAYRANGDQVGVGISAKVLGHSTKQFNDIASRLGVEEDLAAFSVRVGIGEFDVQAFATVVDNLTGDSVLYLSSFRDENRIWLAGVASLTGVNDSQWRTDLWLHNPTEEWLASGEVEFVVGDDPDNSYGFTWPVLGPNAVKRYLDIVSNKLSLEETRGYIVLTGADGSPAPQVSARTYNLDPAGGTYGLNLQAFAPDDLLRPGETGYIAGVSNSEEESVGYRTNMGFLNTDRNGWAEVRITLYDIYGVEAAEPFDFQIAPGNLRQFDVFKKLGLAGVTMAGSVRVEVTSGGGVAVYATEIDNRTQDSIFIQAQSKVVGLPLQ